MLRHLKIKNYALIENLSIDFQSGMTVITGETGAGKSIMLDALGLLAGKRADTSALLDKNQKCIIEAVFDTNQKWFNHFFKVNELDILPVSIIRREISSSGTSRSFINDTPVNLTQLKLAGEQLIDIHSQHQTLVLNDSAFKFNFVDAIADNQKLLETYQVKFKHYQQLNSELQNLLQSEQQSKKDKDYFEFLFSEIAELKLKDGETIELENEAKILSNSQNISHVFATAVSALSEDDENISSKLLKVKNDLQGISKLNSNYEALAERLMSAYVELKDITNECSNELDSIPNDTNRLAFIEERLSLIYKLYKKHGVHSDHEILAIANDLDAKLQRIENFDNEIVKLRNEIAEIHQSLSIDAIELSSKRNICAKNIVQKIKDNLSLLGMPSAEFIIEVVESNDFNEYGKNQISFLFSANKGSEAKELTKVASGGEMSRLMLCVKFLLAQKSSLPTIIFDEIDTGVSGDIAQKMAMMMQGMAKNMQLITITHLAQIAAKGQYHLHVVKEELQDKTISKMLEINGESRITEIAKMLSNSTPGKAAIENAKELLKA